MSQIIVTASQGGGGGALNTLTPSVGGVVSPTIGGTIKLLNGTNINTVGTTNQIVFNLSPTLTGMTSLTFTAAGAITTTGAGALTITTPSGGMIFRGLTAGFLQSEWRTIQKAVQTTDATPTNILSIPLANHLMVSVKALINGFQDDYSDSVGGEILVTAYRAAAGNIILVGAPIINVNYSNPVDTSDIDAVINVGTESLEIQVIGVAAQNWNWVSTISYMYTITA